MNKFINQYLDQLQQSIAIGNSISFTIPKRQYNHVVICGMGGSGIGGALVADLVRNKIDIPVQINQSYFLPAFVNQNSVVFICSYSGHTEETISALQQAIEVEATIICVGTNGEVEKIATQNKLPFIKIPDGLPPRAAFAYPFVQLIFSLHQLDLVSKELIEQLKAAHHFLKGEEAEIKQKANSLVYDSLNQDPFLLYSDERIKSVGLRFKQQLNENSKLLAFYNSVPEMNHNEIVGLQENNQKFNIIFLRNHDDFYRNQQRLDITKQIVSNQSNTVLELWSGGENLIEQSLYLILLTDWMSYFLAEKHGVDSIRIDAINYLKDQLAKNNR